LFIERGDLRLHGANIFLLRAGIGAFALQLADGRGIGIDAGFQPFGFGKRRAPFQIELAKCVEPGDRAASRQALRNLVEVSAEMGKIVHER
jgi:hypothetical protein